MTLNSKKNAGPLDFKFETDEDCFNFDDEIFEVDIVYTPMFSAFNQENEQYRLDRLAHAWGSACAAVNLMSDKYQYQWNGSIISLNDYKGRLRIIWRDVQSRIMFEGVITGAWQRLGERWCRHGLSASCRPRSLGGLT